MLFEFLRWTGPFKSVDQVPSLYLLNIPMVSHHIYPQSNLQATSSPAGLPFACSAHPTLAPWLSSAGFLPRVFKFVLPSAWYPVSKIFRWLNPLLHSGICSNVTSSRRSFLTTLSKIVSTHHLWLWTLFFLVSCLFHLRPIPHLLLLSLYCRDWSLHITSPSLFANWLPVKFV